jgi:hypothetical protein
LAAAATRAATAAAGSQGAAGQQEGQQEGQARQQAQAQAVLRQGLLTAGASPQQVRQLTQQLAQLALPDFGAGGAGKGGAGGGDAALEALRGSLASAGLEKGWNGRGRAGTPPLGGGAGDGGATAREGFSRPSGPPGGGKQPALVSEGVNLTLNPLLRRHRLQCKWCPACGEMWEGLSAEQVRGLSEGRASGCRSWPGQRRARVTLSRAAQGETQRPF